MTLDQGIVYAIIGLTLVMLALEFWRYDLVALVGMLLLVILGIISVEEAFSGFGHPAVVTIAAVLVISRGLQNTGVADLFARWMSKVGDRLGVQLFFLCTLVIFSSAFMNNIAALAIFIPVAVRLARKSDRPTSLYLMPMAFSSHFGGLITLIGTPTNLIVSELRVEKIGERFGMFAFAPVGLAISVVGVAFIAILGWHLIPRREGGAADANDRDIAEYITELKVPRESPLAGKRLRDLDSISEAQVWVDVILREEERVSAPIGADRIGAQDTLLVWADAENLRQFVHDAGLELSESKPLPEEGEEEESTEPGHEEAHHNFFEELKARFHTDDIQTIEAIISPNSMLVDKTARDLDLRARYGVNLLGISRRSEHLHSAVGNTRLKSGDILLLEAHHEAVHEVLDALGCLPLEEREMNLQPRNVVLGIGIFVAAITVASLDILSVPAAMAAAAAAMMMTGVLTLREAYGNVQWPIIVLLGSMLSLGTALDRTGGDQLIANQILLTAEFLSPTLLLVVIMLATMLLSDVVNNTAAVVLTASIAVSVARGLEVSTDPFLVAVAIGGACAFLTPIGHESNVLVLEAGGYEFGDYWRLGLPLEILITAVAIPILLWLWPL